MPKTNSKPNIDDSSIKTLETEYGTNIPFWILHPCNISKCIEYFYICYLFTTLYNNFSNLAIKFHKIFKSNITESFYIWDSYDLYS